MLSLSSNADTRPSPCLAARLQKGRIRQILQQHAFKTAFQPIFCLRTCKVVGVECLTRFQSRPYRTPDTWFREAHEAGLGLELEFDTLGAALEGMRVFPETVFLALNVSPDAVVDKRLGALVERVDPGRVVLELTEHAPVDDYAAVNGALRSLHQTGVRLAIDDVGAGFASMQHILNLRPDLIKIDMGLTRNVHLCAGRSALVAGLVQFAQTVGATVVAEGIELAPQLAHLRELGVGMAQGFLLGRPLIPCGKAQNGRQSPVEA